MAPSLGWLRERSPAGAVASALLSDEHQLKVSGRTASQTWGSGDPTIADSQAQLPAAMVCSAVEGRKVVSTNASVRREDGMDLRGI